MSLPRSVAEILLREHVTLEIKGIDRMYLNVYVRQLQREGGMHSLICAVSSSLLFHLPPPTQRFRSESRLVDQDSQGYEFCACGNGMTDVSLPYLTSRRSKGRIQMIDAKAASN